MMSAPDCKKYYQITSLEKGVKVLETLADHDALTVSQVAARLGLNRAAAHRFLATLRDMGYVEKNEGHRYRLTLRVMEMGMKVANRFEIRQQARKYMQALSATFKETVNLGYWDGTEILHLDKIDSPEILRIDAPLGSKTPAYCTALGKAILAHRSREEIDDFLSRTPLVPHGPNTIVSTQKLKLELDKTRGRGYALDNEELAKGLRCVAAPVFDHNGQAVYALSISCPTMRLPMSGIKQMQTEIREICRQLSAQLGYHPVAATGSANPRKSQKG